MKILFASTPATGHINPLLAITRILLAEGHQITFLTGSAFRDRIENSGAKFVSLQGRADFDGRDFLSVAPELKDIPPGLEWFRVAIERFFLDRLPAQHQSLLHAVQECLADVIVGDDMFYMMFNPNVIYRKKVKDVVWNERNWRWETNGTGFMRKLEQAMER